ncbi:pilus assembly PilX N-terminal domain-containing protein [Candidatus Venteria ishoeyi]|uniref:pilus assembly PilX family protein n=1 Tax=Candidatus Venteria ishoeyi TaxID=1899563 RepID=UPI0025A65E89|nr:pilus assembly PilX N-terminal domain-containing protein [Candidatus Venteria ishoeyi]MDM8547832.1 pilus assembly PilX N-terminal domain-containing protein [Candidatus Venteria ishoeyi]
MNTVYYPTLATTKQQTGAALIVALVFLVVLTLMGVSSMEGTVIETRLAANDREQHWALQTAEIGLMAAIPIIADTTGSADVMDTYEELLTTGESDLEESNIPRKDVSAKSKSTELRYKGDFLVPEGSSMTGLTGAYFEVYSVGCGNRTDDDVCLTPEVGLRGGYMRLKQAE